MAATETLKASPLAADLPSLEELFSQFDAVYAEAERHAAEADQLAAPSADPVAGGLPSSEELFAQFYAAYAEAERRATEAERVAAEALQLLRRLAD